MTREQLRTAGFHFFCFTKPEAREAFKKEPKDFDYINIDEVLYKNFTVYFLGVKKLNHVPVKYTPPRKEDNK